MARKLFTVEDTFAIRGRGTILVPGLMPEADEVPRLGEMIRLLRPDGSELSVAIKGIEFFTPAANSHPILIELPKEGVPVGTEVWSL